MTSKISFVEAKNREIRKTKNVRCNYAVYVLDGAIYGLCSEVSALSLGLSVVSIQANSFEV